MRTKIFFTQSKAVGCISCSKRELKTPAASEASSEPASERARKQPPLQIRRGQGCLRGSSLVNRLGSEISLQRRGRHEKRVGSKVSDWVFLESVTSYDDHPENGPDREDFLAELIGP